MTADGVTTYAIGDVHGRRDLLEALLAAIADDAARQGGAWRIVFLGDIVDRGPESRQALDLVIATLARVPGSRMILGNHEEFLLRFLDEDANREAVAQRWFANGGLPTLSSYGFAMTETVDAIAAAFRQNFPAHVAAMRDADWKVETPRYCLVHGGVDPALPLSAQDPETTRWIREEFLLHDGSFEKTVVHGHTVTGSQLPEVHANRIAVDTGAVRSGRLACAVLRDDAPPRFLAADDCGAAIEAAEIAPLVCA